MIFHLFVLKSIYTVQNQIFNTDLIEHSFSTHKTNRLDYFIVKKSLNKPLSKKIKTNK